MNELIQHVKELDNIHTLLRKGTLIIDQKNIKFHVKMQVNLGKSTYSYNESADISRYTRDKEAYQGEDTKKVFKDIRNKKYYLNIPGFEVSVCNKGDRNGYKLFYMNDRDEEYRKHRWPNDAEKKVKTKSLAPKEWELKLLRARGDLPKGTPVEEWAKELSQEKTVLEWYRFARSVRKYFRKLLVDKKLNGVLNRLDSLKVAKNHKDLIGETLTKLEELQALTTQLAPCISSLPDRYAPLIKVEPYDEMYRSIHYIEDRIEGLQESVQSMIDDLKEEKE
jgi:hypothetical protein